MNDAANGTPTWRVLQSSLKAWSSNSAVAGPGKAKTARDHSNASQFIFHRGNFLPEGYGDNDDLQVVVSIDLIVVVGFFVFPRRHGERAADAAAFRHATRRNSQTRNLSSYCDLATWVSSYTVFPQVLDIEFSS